MIRAALLSLLLIAAAATLCGQLRAVPRGGSDDRPFLPLVRPAIGPDSDRTTMRPFDDPLPEQGGTIPGIILHDLRVALGDVASYFTAPLSFGKRERLYAGGVIGGTAWLMSLDEPLNRSIAEVPKDFLRQPLEWAEKYGNLRSAQYASVGFYAAGLVTGYDHLRVTGRLLGEGLFLSGMPVVFLQYVLGRSRPESRDGAWKFNLFEWSNGKQSFPSGHSTVAFTISTVLAERYGAWVSVPMYLAAGASAYSLLRENQHWTSDVVIGALSGYLAGRYVVGREEEREAEARARGAGGDEAGSDRGRNERNAPRFEIGFGAGGVTARLFILD